MEVDTNYEKKDKILFYSLFIMSIITVLVMYIFFDKIEIHLIMVIVLFSYIILLDNLSLFKYFEYPLKIYITLMVVGLYFIYTIFGVLTSIQNIKNDNYKSDYIVVLKSEIDNYKNLELIDGNSNYLFFINKLDKTVVALPYQDAKLIKKRNLEKD